MPDIVLNGKENGWQNSYQQLYVPLNVLLREAVRVDLDLCEQLDRLFTRRCLDLKTGEIAKVVLK